MKIYMVTAFRKTTGNFEHRRIIGVCTGGIFYTKEQAHDSLKDGDCWIARRQGFPDVQIVPYPDGGERYIQTHPDQFESNNLLNLPDC